MKFVVNSSKDGLDFLRVGNKHNCDPEFHAYLLENKVSQLPDVSKVGELIKSTRIIVGTWLHFRV